MEILVFFFLISNFFDFLKSEDLSDDIEFVRIGYNTSLTRFDALYACKDKIDGSFANSYYISNKTMNWIYAQIYSTSPEMHFHRDVFNDTSYLVKLLNRFIICLLNIF